MSKLSDYYKYVEKNNGLYKINYPLSIQINLTNKCYQKCIGCRKYKWPNSQLEIDDILNIFSLIKLKQNNTIVYSGGEPLIHKEINKIIEVTENNFGMLSSGLWPKNMSIELFKNKYFKWISISIDGSSYEMYKKCRGIDSLDIAIKNISKIKTFNEKLNIRINSTISNINYTEIIGMMKIAKNLNVEINFFPIHTWEDLKLNFDNIVYIVRSAIEFSKVNKIKTNILDFYSMMNRKKPNKCIIPYFHFVVDSNGDVLPCCRLLNDNGEYLKNNNNIIGNVKNEDIYNIINSNKTCEIRKKIFNPCLGECEECDRYNYINKDFEMYLNSNTNNIFL